MEQANPNHPGASPALATDNGGASTSIDKALDLLFHVGNSAEPQPLREIGRALGLPKSSAHRLLRALMKRDLVEQDEAGHYRAGAALLRLAGGVSLLTAARPVLEQGATTLQETFFLVVARDHALVVLDKAEGTGLLRASPAIGGRVPVHATAVGKLYLAFAPDSVRLEEPLPRYTPRTIVSGARLAREVRLTRAYGSAISHDEWIDGLSVAAAPIMQNERMVGAVCVAIPSPRLPELRDRITAAVQQAAIAIALRL